MTRSGSFIKAIPRASLLRLLASLALALILWGWVTTLRDPETTRSLGNVPIAIRNLSSGLVLVDRPSEALVQIVGPESVVESVVASEVTVSADLADISEPGTYTLDLIVTAPDDVWRTRTQPSRIGVTIDLDVSRTFPTEVSVRDLDASSLRSVNVDPEVDEVTVHGPQSAIERIDSILLPLETSGGSRTYETTIDPVAVDENGVAVDGVTVEPESINAKVTVASRGRSVAVLVSTEGSTAPGYEVLDRTSNPAAVVVEGPAEVIDQLIAVSTEPVNIAGASSSVSSSVGIEDLPEGVRVIQPADGQVDVLVQIGQRGVRQALTGLEVSVTNLGPGLAATVSPSEITIEVVAPEEVLSQLTVDSFQVVVDAQGLDAGVHVLEPMVIVPAQVQWISATPVTVDVTISVGEQ